MILKLNDILDRIRLGEDSGAEFKELFFSGERVTEPTRDHLAKEISAMANAKGGWLILGINDKTRKIVGIPADKLEATERYVRDICADSIKPELPVDIYRRELSDEGGEVVPVVLVGVEPGLYVHQAPGGYFRRTGSSARPMSTDFVVRLHQERSLAKLKRFEELPVPRSSMADLDEALWRRFVSRQDEDPEIALCKRSLLAMAEEGDPRATVAGILMCSRQPRKFFPNAFIQAVRYRGTVMDANYQVDAKDFEGPLDQQIMGALAFYRLNQRVAATKTVGRKDHPQYSDKAVFEAIVNAVAHRDYSVDTSKIRFFMYDDRMELYSPGGLVNSMSVAALQVRTATRNERLTNLLSECPLPEDNSTGVGRKTVMERRGEGVGIILRESTTLSGKSPLYELFDDAELRLTIYAAELPNQREESGV